MSKEYLTKLEIERIRSGDIQNEWQQESRRLMNKKFDYQHPDLFQQLPEEFTDEDNQQLDKAISYLKELHGYLRELNIHYCRVQELTEIDFVESNNIDK